MRGKIAKKIRKEVWGDKAIIPKYGKVKDTGQIIRIDEEKIQYNKKKKEYKNGIKCKS